MLVDEFECRSCEYRWLEYRALRSEPRYTNRNHGCPNCNCSSWKVNLTTMVTDTPLAQERKDLWVTE